MDVLKQASGIMGGIMGFELPFDVNNPSAGVFSLFVKPFEIREELDAVRHCVSTQ